MDLEEPQIEWDNSCPRSKVFKDIYFSPTDGIAESSYVFIENNNLEHRWQSGNFKNFTIAETGFGTGLNFILTLRLWQKLQLNNKHLHYISFEKYPLNKEALEKALHAFPELKSFSESLIQLYPKRVSGFHRINISNDVTLTLYFGDATKGITQIHHDTCKIDAWYFDGFSPKQNALLWSETLFQACKQLNKTGTSFSTFTCAGHVKRKLEAIGFTCKKVNGFGSKREMLRGSIENTNNNQANHEELFPYHKKPWLNQIPDTPPRNVKKVAIVGSGLAGAWTAYKLALQNVQVDVFESDEYVANGASGNPRGATYFKIDTKSGKNLNLNQRFYLHAFLYSLRNFQQIFPDNTELWDACGLLQLAFNSNKENLYKHIKKTDYDGSAYWLSNDEVSRLTEIISGHGALYFPDAGSANPKLMCEHLLAQHGIHLKTRCHIDALHYHTENNTWSLETDENLFENYDALVLANSFSATQFSQCQNLPLHTVRGQSTQLKANSQSSKLKQVICTKGYLCPDYSGTHTIGSSFDPRNKSTELLESENQINLDYLKEYVSEFYNLLAPPEIKSAKAALRCQSPDQLPLVGPICDYQDFNQRYAGIAKGQTKKLYPKNRFIPGLYLNVAHASRGIISSPYCAEILCNQILQQTPPCGLETLNALSPIRFYLRDLKKSN